MKYKGKKWTVGGEIIRAWYRRVKPEITQRAEKIFTSHEIRNFELDKLKAEILNQKKPDYITYDFLVRKGAFLGIPSGEKAGIILKNGSFKRTKFNTIEVNGTVNLIYYKGFYIDFDFDLLNVIADDTQRFTKDLEVDASGQQQKDFSRIRTDYSHDELMKDKDIEAEKEKDKARRFGGR